ncbi:MAG: hypothetical protein ACTSUV_04880 [Candidatus Ranarchaeia archaeon]
MPLPTSKLQEGIKRSVLSPPSTKTGIRLKKTEEEINKKNKNKPKTSLHFLKLNLPPALSKRKIQNN